MRSTFLFLAGLVASGSVMAQDTIRKRDVIVTSAFKPVLKDAAKINFNASPATADTNRPRLQYAIPNQNLNFAFQPGSLRPVAMNIDSVIKWDNWNYAKLGYGNFNTPYFETGLSMGNGQNAGLNIYGRHISSKGKIENQKFSNTDIEMNGYVQPGHNLEFTGRFGGSVDRYNRYGFEPKSLDFPDDSIRVQYQNFSTRIGLHNINQTPYGLSYAPEFELNVFSDKLSNRETNAYFNLPLRKTFGNQFEVNVALEGNVTRYSPKSLETIKNSYFSFAPSLLVKTSSIVLNGGIKPTWDNNEFKLLPNISAEISTPNKEVTIQVGWLGYMRSNTFRSFTDYNPWIWAPGFSNNSRVKEIFGGIKGSLTDHFTYNLKLGLNSITNLPLYVNDTVTGRAFTVVTEPDAKVINFTGELGYTVGEKFSLTSKLQLNKYTNLDVNEKAWGLLPFEFTTAMRLQLLKDLYLKTDLYAFDGSWYMVKDGSKRLQGSMDLSAGLEFAIVKNVKLWAQFNNILNREYQRWPQYPVYGFNFLGGVVFSFAKPNN
ncbi:hypothetical protein [Flavisolibacter tropicus]|uniref:TonB-dependent receptor n=1 Tax=Flavisolibacter tropicus TaxID=1492898 RepID=A0A172TS53_9BACT|nr:hypothetical protein [Flavisolibacter tropicus]ANE49901.1 hypothetical protein SY85_04745 [Flavisolibacter tropicus]